jgi:hypothetical protein
VRVASARPVVLEMTSTESLPPKVPPPPAILKRTVVLGTGSPKGLVTLTRKGLGRVLRMISSWPFPETGSRIVARGGWMVRLKILYWIPEPGAACAWI